MEKPSGKQKNGEYVMKDYSLQFVTAKRLLDDYYKAMIAQNGNAAYEIATNLIEVALKLQDIAGEDKKV